MTVIDNPLTRHRHARWIALLTLIVSQLLVLLGYVIPAGWSIYLMDFGLLLTIVPATWCAKRWAES